MPPRDEDGKFLPASSPAPPPAPVLSEVAEVASRAIVAAASGHRDEVLLRLAQGDAEERLLDFVRLVWGVLEPNRPLRVGWALEAMVEHLEAVERGQIRKLLINVPPGFSKSLLTGVFFPAWVWGPRRKPGKRFVSWSYHEALTIRDNRKLRILVESDLYRKLWGDVFSLVGDQNEKKLFETNRTGWSFASSIHGGGTGHRGDFLRVDDPHKVHEAESDSVREEVCQIFAETLQSRTNDAESSFVVVMQRIHERDVSGMILRSGLGFDHLCVPMEYEGSNPSDTSLSFRDPRTQEGELAFPELFPRDRVEDLKAGLRAWGGTYAEVGQLQQRPAPRGGGMFPRQHVQFVPDPPVKGRTVRGWDLAGTKKKRSAYTVGVRMTITDEGRVYIEDVRRLRGTPLEVEEAIRSCAQSDGRGVLISLPQDPGQAGVSQKSYLAGHALQGFDFRFSPESGDKETRARPLAAQWEAGNVFLVTAPWNDEFLKEFCSFPVGEFRDQVDASSRAYNELLRSDHSGESIRGPLLVHPSGEDPGYESQRDGLRQGSILIT